jgi:transposase
LQNGRFVSAWLSYWFVMGWDDWVMAKGYLPVQRDQLMLLPPDMREWLPADHAVHLVIGAVERLDTSALHARRRTGGAGAAGYDPDMLLCLLVWGYACGVTSSRRLEEACWRDVAFRVICGGNMPDHVTIARFRQGFPAVIGELFAQVLVLCARLGMGQLGVVALDGTKMRANAAMSANRTGERLRKLAAEAVAAHGEADAAEDAAFGEGVRGDRVPGGTGRGGSAGGSRDERIAAALARLEGERQEAAEAREALEAAHTGAAAAGTPVRGRPPAGTETELARHRVARAEAAQQAKIEDWQRRAAAAGKRPPGPVPRPLAECARVRAARQGLARAQATDRRREEEQAAGPAACGKAPVRNITDPDSRLMTTARGGFIQGYNAQNVTSGDGLIIATRLTADANDIAWFEPMAAAAGHAAALITSHQPATSQRGAGQPGAHGTGLIGLILADAGYCSEDNLTCDGPDRLIATGKHRNVEKAARASAASDPPGSQPLANGPIPEMATRLRTPAGITAYRQRGHIAETPHRYIKHTMGIRQLTLRGHASAAAEWTFITTVHNIFKAITTGHATPATLAALPA